jgi:phosphoribosylglycinamide formyltransferase-1
MAGTLDKSPDVTGRRDRLVALCRALPEAEAELAGVQHLAFKVRKKIFAYYVYDHHGDGRIALLCKAPPGEQSRLVGEDPHRYFVPPYVGPKGWVGLRLDSARVDWKTVKNLVFVAWFLIAPDKLRQRSGAGKSASSGSPRRRRQALR